MPTRLFNITEIAAIMEGLPKWSRSMVYNRYFDNSDNPYRYLGRF